MMMVVMMMMMMMVVVVVGRIYSVLQIPTSSLCSLPTLLSQICTIIHFIDLYVYIYIERRSHTFARWKHDRQ
jgi:hypothetical protein